MTVSAGTAHEGLEAADAVGFVTCVRDARDAAAARLLVESLRAFGGHLRESHVQVFADDPRGAVRAGLSGPLVDVAPLRVPPRLDPVPFAGVVVACAEAEERATAATLVWVDPRVLFCRPPSLLDLGGDADVGVRPVHVGNVGSPRAGSPDAYWRRLYEELGVADADAGDSVASFVDERELRPYYNSHVLAVRPALALLRRRREHFERLVADPAFLAGPCADEAHRVFLFQAVFAAVVTAAVGTARRRVLPPDYAYPYNLHAEVRAECRATALEELVCFAWEGRSLRPELVEDVRVGEPLRTWLAARVPETPAPA
jgi:hypothetical protein